MKYKLCMILAAGLLMACSSDDDITTPKEEKPVVNTELRPIYVEVSERPMVVDGQEAKERGMETRATETTTASFEGFDMYGNLSLHHKVKKESGVWKVTQNNYWPTGVADDEIIPFHAYTDGTFQVTSGTPYVNFTVSEDAFKQHDLLVATASASYSGQGGKVGTVPLTFDHACAAVVFNIQKTSDLGEALSVHPVVLQKVYKKGKYYFGSGEWQINTEANTEADFSNYTMTNSAFPVTTESNPLPANYLFLIPQTCTKDTKLEITYAYPGQTQSKKTISLAGITWEAGKKYTINIVLGTGLIQ